MLFPPDCIRLTVNWKWDFHESFWRIQRAELDDSGGVAVGGRLELATESVVY